MIKLKMTPRKEKGEDTTMDGYPGKSKDGLMIRKGSEIEHDTKETKDMDGAMDDNSDKGKDAFVDGKDGKIPENKSSIDNKSGEENFEKLIGNLLSKLVTDGVLLDDSQISAVKMALSQRVAIIQGPPGTGKTFIGVQLVKLIMSISSRPRRPILVLTYKNHALDEFLKEMVRIYPRGLVRVGWTIKGA